MTLRIPLLAGAIAGLCSAFYFLGLVAGAGPYVPLLVSILAAAALVWWFQVPSPEIPAKPATPWLRIVFYVVLAAALVAFGIMARKQPHGFWDAWSIWNLHARFLERGGGSHWTALFSPELNWTHPDYPLLVPAVVAQIWAAIHSETVLVPIIVAFLYTFGTVALLIGLLHHLRGWDQALVAGIFILGSAEFLEQGVVQYADVPLSFYMLAALGLLFFEDVKCAALSGAMAAFAAWTKNEGLLFLLALVLARFIARWRFGKIAALAREGLAFAAGAVPVLAVLAIFKFKYAPADELIFAHKSSELMSRMLDFGRYVTVTQAFIKQGLQVGSFLVPAILVLAIYAWLVRFRIEPKQRVGVATAIGAVLLMIAGDFAVYAWFANDVNWQLGTSLDRILMQIAPAALLAFFTATSNAELTSAQPQPRHQHQRDAKKETRKDLPKAAATRRH